MRHMVIGTAGHIDHGKSTLVQALTGIDPDRLKEEKARGITIDLGFAHADLGDDLRVAFVDVPGHERFVRNMLAGATGIDAVLLVVAADESVMPQTREHFAICRLLDVRGGVIVLTKSDLADADLRAVARDEVRELAAGSFLEDAPILEVSARTGEGLDALRDALRAMAQRAPARVTTGAARLPIDRAFSMKGFGAVVTGTLASGRLHVEDELALLPAGRRVRVRGLQVHGARVREAASGQRVAVNLGDIDAAELTRGDTLVTPGALEPTLRCDVVVDLLDDARPLRHGARVRFHQGTREVMGRISIATASARGSASAGAARVESESHAGSHLHQGMAPRGETALVIPAGGRAYARLRLEAPVVLTRGDRFVLRAYSPVTTIGGGVVLDPRPPRGALRSAGARARFAQLDPGASGDEQDPSAAMRAALVMLEEADREGLPLEALVSRAGLAREAAESIAARLVDQRRAIRIADLLLSVLVSARLTTELLIVVRHHHQAQPESQGVPREEARDRIGVAPRVFECLLEPLIAAGQLSGRDRLALPGHRAVVTEADDEAGRRIEALLREAGLKPGDTGELAARSGLPAATIERALALLVRQKRLMKVGSLVFHQQALDRLKDETRALKASAPAGARVTVDVASFKARYDVSRKFAIPLLEYLDRERVTRRMGDERVVL